MYTFSKELSCLSFLFLLGFLLFITPVRVGAEESSHEHGWKTDTVEMKSISTTMHQLTIKRHCVYCRKEETLKTKEKHSLDKYNICAECGVAFPTSNILKPNKVAYINWNSWIRINISQNGYIKGTAYSSDGGYESWALYDSAKKRILDSHTYSRTSCVPVAKGTYYVRGIYTNRMAFKYHFSKDPSKKNYKKAKAQILKRNKPVNAVIYSSAKTTTWKRFYKLTLKKKQFLQFHFESDQYDTPALVELYNSKGNQIPYEGDYGKEGDWIGSFSSNKLPKGTYYIVISRTWTPASKRRAVGFFYTLTWK